MLLWLWTLSSLGVRERMCKEMERDLQMLRNSMLSPVLKSQRTLYLSHFNETYIQFAVIQITTAHAQCTPTSTINNNVVIRTLYALVRSFSSLCLHFFAYQRRFATWLWVWEKNGIYFNEITHYGCPSMIWIWDLLTWHSSRGLIFCKWTNS